MFTVFFHQILSKRMKSTWLPQEITRCHTGEKKAKHNIDCHTLIASVSRTPNVGIYWLVACKTTKRCQITWEISRSGYIPLNKTHQSIRVGFSSVSISQSIVFNGVLPTFLEFSLKSACFSYKLSKMVNVSFCLRTTRKKLVWLFRIQNNLIRAIIILLDQFLVGIFWVFLSFFFL